MLLFYRSKLENPDVRLHLPDQIELLIFSYTIVGETYSMRINPIKENY